ncbi:30S ribosome-binding factor RbfA [Actinocorallia lasiicapitis]
MVDAARARKLADRIQQIVAEMLERRIKDPRLGFVTITDAKITNDLRDATVYYTVYGTDEEKAGTAAALESAKGVIRTEVGRKTGIRHTPSLVFELDGVMDNALQIEELLAKAKKADAEVSAAAVGAEYAGEANPYKADEEDEDESDSEDDDEFEDEDASESGHSSS